MATIIDGKVIAARVLRGVAADIRGFASDHWCTPGLATILIGDNPASAVYVASKRKACAEAGIESFHHHLPADVARNTVLELIDRLNEDIAVSGILCQLPVPGPLGFRRDQQPHQSGQGRRRAHDRQRWSSRARVPGLRPCTPAGVMLLLDEVGVDLQGANAVVIGRSNLFGKPMAQLLLAANATVTVCHSRTGDLADACRRADVLIAAVGRPELVRGDWVKPGAVVIDVGVNRTERGLVGDVAFEEVARVASAITPVPRGVGPMTIACLLRNTADAARARVLAA
jgi:methylenetetrahydrofolate dehydrogenase (NADP+)/methenyltetrahydrofolate cyclohydrolase